MNRLATVRRCVAALLTLAGIAGAQDQARLEHRVDSLFAAQAQGLNPGVAVVVVRDGKVLLHKGYGYASLENRVPITPTTVFDVASVSKQFTGLAVAMLIQDGRIKLTDDIHKYIPELGDLGHTVTIDNLLHHTSGIRDWPGTLSVAGWRYDDVISFDQILHFAYGQRSTNFVPGAEYTYSNTGFNLLAETVQRVTGQPFRVWTDDHLFGPLGMTDSHFRDDHTRVIPNRASGYTRGPGGTYQAVANNLTALGSSSLFSTVDDLAKWVMNFDDAKVGGAAAMAMTRTRGVLNDGSAIPYAFGIVNGDYRGQPNVNHSGGWAGFSTFVLHFPKQRFGVVVLANAANINAGRAAYDLADMYLDSELAPRATVAQSGVTKGPAVSVAPATLDRYAGVYRLGPGAYTRVRRNGGTLESQATHEGAAPMTPRSDTTFWVDGYNAPMIFQRNGADGRVQLVYRGVRSPRLDESTAFSASQLVQFAGLYESDELQTRYRVEVKDGALVMRHPRHGTIALTWLWGNDFGGASSFMRSVEFQRDGAGKVTGFAVNVDERSRNIQFAKRE
ncbi:MAG: hypothetical protein JWM41_217 [Gemmatimonadetes bacterium]|nr:hypothetical protein [Gemmatimonadota bacterium]